MKYLPLSLNVEQQKIALIGDDDSLIHRLRLVGRTEAIIDLFYDPQDQKLLQHLATHQYENLNQFADFKLFKPEGYTVIFSCFEEKALNVEVAEKAKSQNILFNSPDIPEICTFNIPSIVDRTPVTIAISTEGAAPVLAKQIRAHMEAFLPHNLGELAKYAQSLRPTVQERFKTMSKKRRFWENFFSGKIAENFLANDFQAAEKAVDDALNYPSLQKGKLYVLHASEVDYLSVKAARILQSADFIYQIESPDINHQEFADHSRRDADYIKVSTNPDKPRDGELIMQISKATREGKISVIIGSDQVKRRKTKIANHLLNENLEIEHLYSAKSSFVKEQSIEEFAKQFL